LAAILYIETATTVCSAALSVDGKIAVVKQTSEAKAHAQLLTIFIDEILSEAGIRYSELDAVCVSKGPGSYTGLRIGVAVAKGLCYALDKPLIAVNTLYSMTVCMKEQLVINDHATEDILFCPMIDARRMEVYTAIYNYNLEEVSPTKALIVDTASFNEYRNKKLIFFGDGSQKIKPVIDSSLIAQFPDVFNFNSTGMIFAAEKKFQLKQFEDPAYFEPFYLKEFIGSKN
jgi:tRNA threonylcarbamoyladenosine biosynthesis protein TsaB